MLQAIDARPAADSASAASINVRLTAILYAARDTNLYEFRRPDGGILPPAEPGAHIDVHLPNGLMRQYSLVHAGAAPDSYVIGVKLDREGRGGSRCMHERVRVGEILTISPPRNNFPLAATPGPAVLFAGGIGITPIWCMVQHLEEKRRPWQLFYSCRSREDAAFLAPLAALGPRVTLHFDDENDGRFLDLAGIIATLPTDAELYGCGPQPMLAAFEAATAGPLARTGPCRIFHAEDGGSLKAASPSSSPARARNSGSRPASRSSPFCATPASTLLFPARKASAAPAKPMFSRASPIIATIY